MSTTPAPRRYRKRWTTTSYLKLVFYAVVVPVVAVVALMWAAGRSTPEKYQPLSDCHGGSHLVMGYSPDGSVDGKRDYVVFCGQEKSGHQLWALYFDQRGPDYTRLSITPLTIRADGSFSAPAGPNDKWRRLIYVVTDDSASRALAKGPMTRTSLPHGARQLMVN